MVRAHAAGLSEMGLLAAEAWRNAFIVQFKVQFYVVVPSWVPLVVLFKKPSGSGAHGFRVVLEKRAALLPLF
jgi:hypothetical protein